MRKVLSLLMAYVIIFQVMGVMNVKKVQAAAAEVTTNIAKLRILELTDTDKLTAFGETAIKKYKPAASEYSTIEITTMSMKTFAAMREEIDGKYDVIYLSSAYYSTATKGKSVELSNFNAHLNDGNINSINGLTVMNDITQLKVEQINDFLQDKNNYLVIHQDIEDIHKIDSSSLVYTTYKDYASGSKTQPNVLVIDSSVNGVSSEVNEATNFYNKLFEQAIRQNISLHPNLVNVQGLETTIAKGELKEIKFQLSNAIYLKEQAKTVKAYLYADNNANGFFEDTERASQTSIIELASNETVYSISYMPEGYYKNVPIKLEVVAENGSNQTKFYQVGVFTFNGDRLNTNVLQVLGQGVTQLDSFSDAYYNVNIVGRYLQKNPPNNNSRNELIFEYDASKINLNSTDVFEQKVFDKIVEIQAITNPSYTFAKYKTENAANKLKLYNDAKIACYLEEYDEILLGISEQRYLKNISSNLTAQEANTYVIYFNELLEQFKNNNNKRVIFTRDVFRKENGDIIPDTLNQNFSGALSGNSDLTITAQGNVGVKTIAPVNRGVISKPKNFDTQKIGVDFQGVFRLNLNQEDIVVWYNCATGGGDNSYDLYHTYSKGNLVFTQAGAKKDDLELVRNIILMAGQSIHTNNQSSQHYQRNVLEITQSGVSDIKALSDTYNLTAAQNDRINVVTLSMKEFIALRQQLEGKYDAIYIGTGTYSTTKPARSNTVSSHNTSNIDNDITKLKVDEIEQYYLGHGYEVIALSGIKTLTTQNSKLKAFANKNNNIQFASNVKQAFDLIKATKGKRPVFELISAPSNDLVSQSYKVDDVIAFEVQLKKYNSTSNYSFNLYYDDNYNNVFANRNVPSNHDMLDEASEKRDQTSYYVQDKGNGRYKISYKLPIDKTCIKNWLLEAVEEMNTTAGIETKTSYSSDFYKFKGAKLRPRVLSIMPEGISSTGVSINESTLIQEIAKPVAAKGTSSSWYGMDYNRLNKAPDEYEIEVEAVLMSDFVKYCNANTNEAAVTQLRARYSMMMFGFKDEYFKYAKIDAKTADVINGYMNPSDAKLARSVFFSHDTFNDYNADATLWRTNFADDYAQTGTITNMGNGGAIKTTTAKQVNTGLTNMYPYNLTGKANNKISIGQTHAQYIGLDLEKQQVIPWYNVDFDGKGGITTLNDSINHYYTYTVGDFLTMTGAGHSTSFAEDEKELFINTMYRSALNVNMAPIVRINKGTGIITGTAGTGGDYDFVDTTIKNEADTDEMQIVDIKAPLLMANQRFTLNYTPFELDADKEVTLFAQIYDGKVTYKLDSKAPDLSQLGSKLSEIPIGTTSADGTYRSLVVDASGFKGDYEFVIKLSAKDSGGFETIKYINVTPYGIALTSDYSINSKDKSKHLIKVFGIHPQTAGAIVSWSVEYSDPATGTVITKPLSEPNPYLEVSDVSDNQFMVTAKQVGKVKFIATYGALTGSCQVTVYKGGFLSPIKTGAATFDSAIGNVANMRTTPTLSASAITSMTQLSDFKIELEVDTTNPSIGQTHLNDYVNVGDLKLEIYNKQTGANVETLDHITLVGNKATINSNVLSNYFAANPLDNSIYNIDLSINSVGYKMGLSMLDYQNKAVLGKQPDVYGNRFVDFKVKVTCNKTEYTQKLEPITGAFLGYEQHGPSNYVISDGSTTRLNYIAIPNIR